MVKTTNVTDILYGCKMSSRKWRETVKYECQKTKWLGPKTKLST